MEGPLWLKTKKNKLVLNGWEKRYFVLTSQGLFQEYLDDTDDDMDMDTTMRTINTGTVSSINTKARKRKMELQSQILLSSQKNLHIKKISLPLAGKSNAFVITTNSITITDTINTTTSSSTKCKTSKCLKILVAAKNSDTLRRWLVALNRFCVCQQEQLVHEEQIDDETIERTLEQDKENIEEKLEWMEIIVTQQKEMSNLLRQHDFTSSNRLRTTNTLEWTLDPMNQVDLPQGSILIKINGTRVKTIERMVLLSMLQPEKLPLALCFYLPIYKQGCLKYKNTNSLSHQLKTTFIKRATSTGGPTGPTSATGATGATGGTSMMMMMTTGWKERVVIVATDTLMYHPVSGTPQKKQKTMKRLVLTNCQVYPSFVNTTAGRLTHEFITQGGHKEDKEQTKQEDKYCFIVSNMDTTSSGSSTSSSRTNGTTSGGGGGLAFQVRNEFELVAWIRVIERAIQVANRNNTKSSLITSSAFASATATASSTTTTASAFASATATASTPTGTTALESSSSSSTINITTDVSTTMDKSTSSFSRMSSGELSDLLVFLQRNGRYIEALQLMTKKNPHEVFRPIYWKKIFAWAIEPFDQKEFEFLLTLSLNEEYVSIYLSIYLSI
jgi:hypothetical protein